MHTSARRFCPFALGSTVSTPGALAAFERTSTEPRDLLDRHACGDWGEVDSDDAKANDDGTVSGDRLLSAYRLSDGTRIWVITESDRTITTLLLPEEY